MPKAHPHIIKDLEKLRAEGHDSERLSSYAERMARPDIETIQKIGGPAAQAVLTYADRGLQWGIRMDGDIYSMDGKTRIGNDPHPNELTMSDESHEAADR